MKTYHLKEYRNHEGRHIRYRIDKNGCWICTSHKPNGMGYPHLTRKGKKSIRMSRYVYKRFNGKIPKGLHVRHKCDNTMCINPDHLELGTHQDNMEDMVDRGRQARGEKHGTVKLSKKNVKVIIKDKTSTHKELAERFGVHETAIAAIKYGKTWKHVSGGRQQESYFRKGSACTTTHLTEDDVLTIRESDESPKVLAKLYNVGATTISHIQYGKSWKHVGGRLKRVNLLGEVCFVYPDKDGNYDFDSVY